MPPGRRSSSSLLPKTAAQHIPARTTKVSEKLVLLPETVEDNKAGKDFDEDNDVAPTRDDEEAARRRAKGGKSYAERLPKSRRAEKLARVTAYCTAEAYNMRATAAFVRNKHHARTKLYDDCLYTVYHLPLLPGADGFRLRSSPVLRNPGGKSVLDEEIERSEQSGYHDGDGYEEGELSPSTTTTTTTTTATVTPDTRPPLPPSSSSISSYAEMFVFSYGVVVFWNVTEKQEKDILADLTFSSAHPPASTNLHHHLVSSSISSRPQHPEDFETEEFHFEYNPDIPRPRVFNDMITLRSRDHMVKLAMSHAIAQSTKLSFFEERMAHTMAQAQYIPRKLAMTGELGLKREEVVRILGSLFKSRVDVNLSSNILDIPNFFWESEPTLHPLYIAVREYLEIQPRINALNEKCQVFLDLAAILSDSIADQKMSKITWIIIYLIIISIIVTCSEVFLRFGILTGRGRVVR
ncbi:MAG: hypothetical protein M1816_005696 [Peltula sp. TS41687]|nr:MAG: hypothetical protein M1816_005696 [Peltula sp. TS41687]